MYSINRIDQNDAISSVRSYSTYEPEKNNKIFKHSAIVLLIIALILVIALVISISLVFTIGLKAAQRNTFSSENLSTILPYEPCMCGCPSIQPLFNDETKASARIINGETARAHSWPWQILLIAFDSNQTPISFCGATIITERHILTAAHCVHLEGPPIIVLFPGKHSLNLDISLTSGYVADKIYIHEGYNLAHHHDIAILTIREPLRFDSYIRPICLATPHSSVLQANEELVAIGWGRIYAEPETNIYAQSLQQVKLAYVPTSHPNCSEIFEPGVAHPGQMCAGKPGYNACQGDSGGPLMRQRRIPNTENYYWEQIGITSATIDCGWNSTWPDIYTNIPYYYDWIMATIKRAV